MLTDAILRLKAAFAEIPMQGLFFWEGLLFFKDEEYKKVVEEKLTEAISELPADDKETLSYYNSILDDLREVRKEILNDPAVRDEVEKIRDALIDSTAHDTIIDAMKTNLEKEGEGKE